MPHDSCKEGSYTTMHLQDKTLICWEKEHRTAHISLVSPTTTIYTIVTYNSQPLMESIKPCKYLQDKGASRQSIPIYRTMEGSTEAVFQVREINKVSFGNKGKKINNNLIAAAPLSLSFLICSLLPSITLTPCAGSSLSSRFDTAGCASQQVSGTAGSASRNAEGDSF